jgi:hypothetical protein
MYRKVFVAKEAGDLTIKLPEEFLNKRIAIVAFEQSGSEADRDKKLAEAQVFFKKMGVDMSNFKFDRNEANER